MTPEALPQLLGAARTRTSIPGDRAPGSASIAGAVGPVSAVNAVTVLSVGSLAVLRRRRTVAAGYLLDGITVVGERMVTAVDPAGQNWWVPARSVWSDADADGRLAHPSAIGLAIAPDWHTAVLSGLSDRLGWEAVCELERGTELPTLDGAARDSLGRELADASGSGLAELTVLDGRLVADVPTAVVVGPGVMRWGAGATWSTALRRALFGDSSPADADTPSSVELGHAAALLAAAGLGVVGVDLGTPQLTAIGIARCSVQLVGE